MGNLSDAEILGYLKALIAAKSENPPGNELTAAKVVAGILEREGIPYEIQEPEPGRANIIAATGPKKGRPIILTGHLDVVPPGEGWDTNPYEPTCHGGRCWGRGSSDMKGGIAAMLGAFVRIHRGNCLRNTRLMVAFVYDEEINGKGTRYYLEAYPPESNARVIIGEPTEREIHIAHRGVIRLKLRTTGKQAHSAFPQQGSNAIVALGRLLRGVEDYHEERQKTGHALLPPPTVSCTVINGGVKDNVIPPAAECVIDCRTVPGDTPEKLMSELGEFLEHIPLPYGTGYELSCFLEMPPAVTAPDCSTVKLAQEAFMQEMEGNPCVKDFPACSDMPQFTGRGLEAVLWGPGEISQAHVVNESIEIQQIYDMARVYQKFAILSDQEETDAQSRFL